MTRSIPRRRHGRVLATLVAAGLVLAGCTGDDPQPTDGASDQASDGAMSESEAMAESEAMDDTTTPSAGPEGEATNEGPSAAAQLDVTATTADGATITLADYPGKPVFVETFATWCSNCRSQLGDTQAAAVAEPDAIFLALSVESDLDPARLADYASENGFTDLTFAVLDDESLASLADHFGTGVLVPPSTPKFTVATDGSLSELTTGFESSDEILDQLGPTS